jgi:hypothetical protein
MSLASACISLRLVEGFGLDPGAMSQKQLRMGNARGTQVESILIARN